MKLFLIFMQKIIPWREGAVEKPPKMFYVITEWSLNMFVISKVRYVYKLTYTNNFMQRIQYILFKRQLFHYECYLLWTSN